MRTVSQDFLDSSAAMCRMLYRMSGLRGAFAALMEAAHSFVPVDRINALHVPLDFSCVVSIMDTEHNRSRPTVFRQPGEAPPLLMPEKLTEPMLCGNLGPFKDPALLENPVLANMPFLSFNSLLRFPIFQDQHAVLLMNFLSLQDDAFQEEDLELLQRLVEPLGEELRQNFASLQRLTPTEQHAAPQSYMEQLTMCPGLEPLCVDLKRVAASTGTVLILGETGVGKECVARAVHELSARSGESFVAVNCGAIPEGLVDSELFGHERGAFTGAHALRIGHLELAHRGTLFLDEIGDMPLASQTRLLRALETRSITRVGSSRLLPIDVRIIAATHVDLEKRVQEGLFRKDLWYRLALFPFTVPPLRSRKGDISALVTYFIHKKARDLGIPSPQHIPREEITRLYAHSWPGNVRELEYVVERSLIMHGPDAQTPLRFDFGHCLRDSAAPARALRSLHEDWPSLEELETRYIYAVLEQCAGKVMGPGSATEILGIHYSTLRSRMLRLGIPLPRAGRTGQSGQSGQSGPGK